MKQYKTLFFILLLSIQGFCQNNTRLDSLLNVLKTVKEDTNKVNALVEIGTEYSKQGDYNKAIENSNKALKLAQSLNYSIGIARSTKNLGDNAIYTGDYTMALKYYSSALKICENVHYEELIGTIHNNVGLAYFYQANYLEALKNYATALKLNKKQGNKKQLSNTYNNLGQIYQHIGNYPEAINNLFASIKLRDEIGDNKNTAQARINIGSVYFLLKKYPLALENYSAGLKLSKELNNKNNIGQCYNGIGGVYSSLGRYPEAFKNYFAALKINEEIGNIDGQATLYINIGTVYAEQGNYPEALKNYFNGLKICEQNGIKWQITSYYCNIGGVFIKQRKFQEAKHYLSKGLEISKELGRKEDFKLCYYSLAILDSTQGNYKQAYLNRNLYFIYKDSLVNEDNTKKIVQSQMQYEFDKKDAELKAIQDKKDALTEEQNKIKELQLSRTKYISFALAFLLLLLIAIGLLIFRQNKLKSEQQKIQLEQKLLRSQMNPHFIFNSLQAIQNFITEKEAIKYLSSFGSLTRSVLENSRMESIPLSKEIKLLNQYLELQKLLHEDQFKYSINIASDLNTENINLPPMLSQPFIENAIEHGMRDIESGGLIEISFSINNTNLFLEIKDNGKGISKNDNKEHHSLATTITKERINLFNKKKSHKASFAITEAYPNEIRKGVKVNFIIPI